MAPEPRRAGTGRHPDSELLDAYADGERTPGSVDRHVRGCPACQHAVLALRQVQADLARLATVTMPPEVATRIKAALEAAGRPAAAPPRPSSAEPSDARSTTAPGRPTTSSPAATPAATPGSGSAAAGRAARLDERNPAGRAESAGAVDSAGTTNATHPTDATHPTGGTGATGVSDVTDGWVGGAGRNGSADQPATTSGAPGGGAPPVARMPAARGRGRGRSGRAPRREPALAASLHQPAARRRRGPDRSASGDRGPATRPSRPAGPGALRRAAGNTEPLTLVAVFLVIVVTGTGLFTVLRRGSVAGSADLPTASLARAPAASDTAAGQSGGAATEQQGPGVWIPVADTGDDVDEGAADARRETVEKHGQDLIAGRIPTVGRLLLVSSTESAALGAVAPDAAAPPATDAAAAAAAAAGQPTPSAGSGAAGSVPAPALASAVPAAVAALGTPNLLTCYQRLAATSGGRVVAVDRVSYDGHQAVLVILDTPDATSSASSAGAAGDSFQITVIDTRCAASRMADALWYSATAVRA